MAFYLILLFVLLCVLIVWTMLQVNSFANRLNELIQKVENHIYL
ncbi:MAG: hypothetical protein V1913_08435 [Fibrobacterota bacterium]